MKGTKRSNYFGCVVRAATSVVFPFMDYFIGCFRFVDYGAATISTII